MNSNKSDLWYIHTWPMENSQSVQDTLCTITVTDYIVIITCCQLSSLSCLSHNSTSSLRIPLSSPSSCHWLHRHRHLLSVVITVLSQSQCHVITVYPAVITVIMSLMTSSSSLAVSRHHCLVSVTMPRHHCPLSPKPGRYWHHMSIKSSATGSNVNQNWYKPLAIKRWRNTVSKADRPTNHPND